MLTSCPVTHIVPIGGYQFEIVGAEFIASNVPAGAKVHCASYPAGVDVLETRWSAAKHIFGEKGIKILGAEFTDGDRAKTKSIVSDYIARHGQIDAVWMDAGATSTAAIEAFEDAGMKYPVINGEDQQDFLQKWQSAKLKAIAPTYPTYQWRTAIIAALHILKGEQVPGAVWNLPDPAITQANLDKYVNPKLPPLHYAMCGCRRDAELSPALGREIGIWMRIVVQNISMISTDGTHTRAYLYTGMFPRILDKYWFDVQYRSSPCLSPSRTANLTLALRANV